MKIFASAALLAAGTVLLTFTGLSYALFPRPLSLENPDLLTLALAVAGLVFFGMGARGLHRIHLLSANDKPAAAAGVPAVRRSIKANAESRLDSSLGQRSRSCSI